MCIKELLKDLESEYKTGDMVISLRPYVPSGWLLIDHTNGLSSIGCKGSKATARADNDVYRLYKHMWTADQQMRDQEISCCAMIDGNPTDYHVLNFEVVGGKGQHPCDDFHERKLIMMPDSRDIRNGILFPHPWNKYLIKL